MVTDQVDASGRPGEELRPNHGASTIGGTVFTSGQSPDATLDVGQADRAGLGNTVVDERAECGLDAGSNLEEVGAAVWREETHVEVPVACRSRR